MWMNEKNGFDKLNKMGRDNEKFLFIISFDRSKIFASNLKNLNNKILYKLDNWSNCKDVDMDALGRKFIFEKFPTGYSEYKKSIDQVKNQIKAGNTYLLNLTFPTPIYTNMKLGKIFRYSKAKYKLYLKNRFVCFSPEKFIEIEKNTVAAYPMKGTIDASVPNARESILSDEKEKAEHTMITDLMRNDLNKIAKNVKVENFRYIDKIKAGNRELLQISSKISGILDSDWRRRLGNILAEITPAGSITGTPKKKTVSIIKKIERYERGFYTGIFGVCKGDILRSAVMIRFIEKEDAGLIYKSGGGITLDSDPAKEYEELLEKIYIPI